MHGNARNADTQRRSWREANTESSTEGESCSLGSQAPHPVQGTHTATWPLTLCQGNCSLTNQKSPLSASYVESILLGIMKTFKNVYFRCSWHLWSVWSGMSIKYTQHQIVYMEKKSWGRKSPSLKVKHFKGEAASFGGLGRGREGVGAGPQQGGQDWGRETPTWLAQGLCRGAAGNNAENSILKLISPPSTY